MDWRDTVKAWLDGQERDQAYLAGKAGIRAETLSRILSGKQQAGERVLNRLERAMGLDRGGLMALRDAARSGGER